VIVVNHAGATVCRYLRQEAILNFMLRRTISLS